MGFGLFKNERRKVGTHSEQTKQTYTDGGMPKGTKETTERAPNHQSYNNLNNNIGNIEL